MDEIVSRETFIPGKGQRCRLTNMCLVDDAMARFASYAHDLGLVITDQDRARLIKGAQCLARLSAASGLSGYSDPAEALVRAMGPALAYFGVKDAPQEGRLADLGCGNGALGATIALFAPKLTVDLVDRAQRAYTTSEMLVARLELVNANARLTSVTALHADYHVVVFRAFAAADHALKQAISVASSGALICAFHRQGDTGFADPPFDLCRLGTTATLVPDLVMTSYRR